MPSVLHTIRRMTRDDPAKRHGWSGPPSSLARTPTGFHDGGTCECEAEKAFFGTPRIASSCWCSECWSTPATPGVATAADYDEKPLPFLPTKRKPPPKLDFEILEQAQNPYPSPPAETVNLPTRSGSATWDSLSECGSDVDSLPEIPPPLPEKDPTTPQKDTVGPEKSSSTTPDRMPTTRKTSASAYPTTPEDVKAVRQAYAPVSETQLESLYDEIWTATSASVLPRSPSISPRKVSAPTSASSGCSQCSACVLRARRSACSASLSRSPKFKRPSAVSYRQSAPMSPASPLAKPVSASYRSPPLTPASPSVKRSPVDRASAPLSPSSPPHLDPAGTRRVSSKRMRAARMARTPTKRPTGPRPRT